MFLLLLLITVISIMRIVLFFLSLLLVFFVLVQLSVYNFTTLLLCTIFGGRGGALIGAVCERAVGEREATRERRELVRERGVHDVAGRRCRWGGDAAGMLHGPGARGFEQATTAATAAGQWAHGGAHRRNRQTLEVTLHALPPALSAARLHRIQVLNGNHTSIYIRRQRFSEMIH